MQSSPRLQTMDAGRPVSPGSQTKLCKEYFFLMFIGQIRFPAVQADFTNRPGNFIQKGFEFFCQSAVRSCKYHG